MVIDVVVSKTLSLLYACLLTAFAATLVAPSSAANLEPAVQLPGNPLLQVSDTDGDGLYEAESEFSTPPCGCNCPVVGVTVEADVAGSSSETWAATSGCQTAWDAEADPNSPNIWSGAGAQATPYFYPGGLEPLIDTITGLTDAISIGS